MQNTTEKALIDVMVSRFLGWKLPKDFAPDAGISFNPGSHQEPSGPHWPSGTSLLHAEQARHMIEHMLGGGINPAAMDVLSERCRQIEAEGWTPEHDDEHVNDEIAALACFYTMPPRARDWSGPDGYGETLGAAMLPDGWKATTGDRRRELVKAGALILAEIERLDRSEVNAKAAKGEG